MCFHHTTPEGEVDQPAGEDGDRSCLRERIAAPEILLHCDEGERSCKERRPDPINGQLACEPRADAGEQHDRKEQEVRF